MARVRAKFVAALNFRRFTCQPVLYMKGSNVKTRTDKYKGRGTWVGPGRGWVNGGPGGARGGGGPGRRGGATNGRQKKKPPVPFDAAFEFFG